VTVSALPLRRSLYLMPNTPVTIHNPILKGFNPDPSIVRVGENYYIATSTFEWYPGVQIHHSRDLVHWRLAVRPLADATLLDLRGRPDSCGVWAPCLTYADGLFWLVYSDVRRKEGNFKDVINYVTTAAGIEGPWSEPVYLNASGFDPSLFHDEDGRKWLVNLSWDHRARPSKFGGIVLQEYDPTVKRLVGEAVNIFRGSPHGLTEGPHLFRRGGYYYLMTAEGGTSYRHAVTLARSTSLTGPYELHPQCHVLTSRFEEDARLQRAGHGDLVDTPAGETYLVHLASRPIAGLRRCVLGRETAIQKVAWGEDGWLRLAGGGMAPFDDVPAPTLAQHPFASPAARHDFDEAHLPDVFQWLRTPYPERIFSLSARAGHLRLIGRESPGSWFEQALVARRQTALAYEADTQVEAQPRSYQQMAGLIAYYNRYAFHYLALTHDEVAGACLQVFSCAGDYPQGTLTVALDAPVPVDAAHPVRMKVVVDGCALRFFHAQGAADWQRIGPVLDASLLSDEAGQGPHGNFTGAFVGMAAHDVSGMAMTADFDFFGYEDVI
jgi:xylan 1,4-beta-xylosidase